MQDKGERHKKKNRQNEEKYFYSTLYFYRAEIEEPQMRKCKQLPTSTVNKINTIMSPCQDEHNCHSFRK